MCLWQEYIKSFLLQNTKYTLFLYLWHPELTHLLSTYLLTLPNISTFQLSSLLITISLLSMILTFVDSPHETISVSGVYLFLGYLLSIMYSSFVYVDGNSEFFFDFSGWVYYLCVFIYRIHISYSTIYLTNKILDCFLSGVSLNMLQWLWSLSTPRIRWLFFLWLCAFVDWVWSGCIPSGSKHWELCLQGAVVVLGGHMNGDVMKGP